MDFSVWLVFVATYAVISAIPGPSVLMVISQALSNGRRAAFLCILGDVTGGVLLIALSLFGLGAIVENSVILYDVIKWGGVCYLLWLGVQQIRNGLRASAPAAAQVAKARVSVGIGFMTGMLNPKAIAFYTAFLAQFIDPDGNLEQQFVILSLTSVAVVGGVLGAYAMLASQARVVFRSPSAQRWFGFAGGGFLIGGSVWMAAR